MFDMFHSLGKKNRKENKSTFMYNHTFLENV